ncbi:LexA family protein [Streptomyces sp. NPDC056441]|uniref:LexA family protein n=1 Tax=Streptomyces sp. NPDC056441 TaxID=3345817 RepID=UPI003685E512
MSTDAPTDRQVQILRVIRNWIADHGEGPSIRQIGERVGLSSSSSVAYQLGRLEDRGLVSRTGRRWRSCRLGKRIR